MHIRALKIRSSFTIIVLALAYLCVGLDAPATHASIEDVAFNVCTRGLLVTVYGTEEGYAAVTYTTHDRAGEAEYIWSYERRDGSWIDFYFTEFPTPIPFGATGQLSIHYPGASATRDFVAYDNCRNVSQSQVGGISYEDRNEDGMRDPDEPVLPNAFYKITDGGNWFRCGFTAGDGTYNVSIDPGSYYIFPIAPQGYRPVALRIRTNVAFGGSNLDANLGFVKDPSAPPETCDLYNPPRGGDMPIVIADPAGGEGVVRDESLGKSQSRRIAFGR